MMSDKHIWYVDMLRARTRLLWINDQSDCSLVVNKRVASVCAYPISARSFLAHMTSSAAMLAATNSASTVDVATIDCFVDFHVIGVPERMSTYPVVDLRESRSPAQSEST